MCLILAKSESKRLPNKNTLDFNGEPMFMVNVIKCLKLFKKVYVSSDDADILEIAYNAGAIPILRGKSLCGDTPNIPVYQHALSVMRTIPKGIVAIQANSPNIGELTIAEVIRAINIYDEVMTCHRDETLYGSAWGIKTDRILNYGDPYKPDPDYLVWDDSIDIHTKKDYKLALSI